MSKKKRRDKGGESAAQQGGVILQQAVVLIDSEAEAARVSDAVFEAEPTRLAGQALAVSTEGAAAELDEDEPTRAGARATVGLAEVRATIEAEERTRELDEDEPTRTAARAVQTDPVRIDPAQGASVEAGEEGGRFEDHRFDFGRGETLSEGEDVPPDPGSADSASPRLQSIVESLLFAADRPLSLRQLAELVEESELERIRAAVLAVEQSWRERGVQLHEVAGGYQFRTHPVNAVWVQKLLQAKPVRLSRALLETLAIVSYRQPITRPEIDEIRGVDSGGTLKTLMDRVLVRVLGKKEEVGRPLLYGTTKEFLEFFSLRDLKDLPTLREYHELSEEHQAQVAALEGAAPEGSIVPDGELVDEDVTEALPKLSRLEIAAPIEDAAELAEIDRLIRTAGIATDDDLPAPDPAADASPASVEELEPMGAGATAEPADAVQVDAVLGDGGEDLAVTGKFESVSGRRVDTANEFDDERVQTGIFGEPLAPAELVEPAASDGTSADFESEESTRLRGDGLDAELVDGRDPNKEPAA